MSSSATKHREVTITVSSSALSDSYLDFFSYEVSAGGILWEVTLARQASNFAVSVSWIRKFQDTTWCNVMYVVSHQDPISFKSDDLVLSPAHKSNELILTLLKDPASVDVAFMFTSDDAFSGVGLWAHSAILSRYMVFEELIQHGKTIQSSSIRIQGKSGVDGLDVKVNIDSDSDSCCTLGRGGGGGGGGGDTPADLALPAATVASHYDRAIVIKVDKVSLKTMCVLLYYIYTDGIIDRSVKLGRFAISRRVVIDPTDDDSDAPMLWCDTEGRFDGLYDWNPLENGSPWILRDVNWHELLEVATLFQLSDLQALCRVGVIDGINESNAVDILFSNSAAIDPEIKEAALATIVKNMGTILDKDKDPFLPYRKQLDFSDVLIQIMRLKAKEN
ncbi:hypothetical protein BGZ96_004024 [Linnemannia gamsii]|uniref:BTB domain-containing protein n=1 Tax=Linnemannia gamsii TaxID=64522 RepID=A0ABQ7K8Q3_9FUNG|nr:hypothetical protein BGZ96_004024 [Linnemannia gamsii]